MAGTNIIEISLRSLGVVLCLITFSILAACRFIRPVYVSSDDPIQIRFDGLVCTLVTNVVAFVYLLGHIVFYIVSNLGVKVPQKGVQLSIIIFATDQVMAYTMLACAAAGARDSKLLGDALGWGLETDVNGAYTAQSLAAGGVTMGFLAFVALGLTSLLSAHELSLLAFEANFKSSVLEPTKNVSNGERSLVLSEGSPADVESQKPVTVVDDSV